jgi:hypothetical protein
MLTVLLIGSLGLNYLFVRKWANNRQERKAITAKKVLTGKSKKR